MAAASLMLMPELGFVQMANIQMGGRNLDRVNEQARTLIQWLLRHLGCGSTVNGMVSVLESGHEAEIKALLREKWLEDRKGVIAIDLNQMPEQSQPWPCTDLQACLGGFLFFLWSSWTAFVGHHLAGDAGRFEISVPSTLDLGVFAEEWARKDFGVQLEEGGHL